MSSRNFNYSSNLVTSIYIGICLRSREAKDSTIYAINPFVSTPSSQTSSPETIAIFQDQGFSFAVANSKLFFFGGDKDPQQTVVYDMSNSKVYRANNMLAKRNDGKYTVCPSVPLVFDNKIFVFGINRGWKNILPTSNISHYAPDPWVEFFNVNSGTWNVIRSPPQELIDEGLILSIILNEKASKIFLATQYSDFFYCYNVLSQTWSTIETSFKQIRSPNYRTAVVDDHVYVYKGGYVYGFDLATDKWLSVLPIRGLEMIQKYYYNDNFYIPGSVFHLGDGILCVVWFPMNLDPSLFNTIYICYATFRVSKLWVSSDYGYVLQALILAEGAYLVPGDTYIDACIDSGCALYVDDLSDAMELSE